MIRNNGIMSRQRGRRGTATAAHRGPFERLKTKSAFAVIVAFCSGCVVAAAGPGPAGVVVAGPPPPPHEDVRVTAPSGTAVWVAGYWHWTGIRYAWIPGHWDAPRSGARWVPPRYILRDGVYYYEPGGWVVAH